MRRVLVLMPVVGIAIVLGLGLQYRKQVFIAARVDLLSADDDGQAGAARQRLQRVGRSAVRPVCALLEHDDPEVRGRAALTLANIGHAAACGPLMEAAKRGDFPAADALAFMKHPRAREARAWAYWQLGDKAFEESEIRSPVGRRLPTAPCVYWSAPLWFGWQICVSGEWHTTILPVPAPDWRYVTRQAWLANSCYMQALEGSPLTGALIGRARVETQLGRYATAAELYARALDLSPASDVARKGKAEAEQLARLGAKMEALLPSAYRVHRILTHNTWRQDEATQRLAVITFPCWPWDFLSTAPKLVVFAERGGKLERAGGASTYSPREYTGRPAWDLETYVGLCVWEAGEPAGVMVVRSIEHPGGSMEDFQTRVSEMTLYRLESGTLVEMLRLPSAAIPWVGDVDGDGDAEVVTWRDSRVEVWPTGPPLAWPAVHTLVSGRYEERTERFPALFAHFVPGLTRQDSHGLLGPGGLVCLGRAYEILGERELALRTYERAEGAVAERSVGRAFRDQAEADQVIGHALKELRQRRERLEAQVEGG